MPSKPAARPAPEGNELRQRLAAVRRRLRRTAVLRGVSWLLLCVSVLLVAEGYLDCAFHLPALLRAVILVAALVNAGLLAWRYLVKPLSERSDDLSLALRIEERFPNLNDALASTVQFLGAPAAPAGDSASMRREAVQRALAKAKGCDFNRIVNARGLRTAVGLAAFATVGALAMLFFFPSAAWSAMGRLLYPFNNRPLPTQTQLTLIPDPPRDRVGRNEAYEIAGRVTGVVPPNAVVTVAAKGKPSRDYTIDVTPDGPKSGTLALRLEPESVQQDFHFRVRANDYLSADYEVQVLMPPALAPLGKLPSPQLQLFFPRYTGLPSPQALTPSVGNIDAVVGTSVVLRAAANRRLRAAWVEYHPNPKELLPASELGALGAADLTSFLALSGAGNAVWGRVDAELDDDHMSFTVRFLPRIASGMYVLHFEDETGLAGNRPFEIRLHDDPQPTVHLDRPSKTRDVLNLLPAAQLPLELAVEDPLYGLHAVFLEYRMQPDRPWQRLMLHDPDSVVDGVLSPLMGPAVAAAAPALRPARLEFRRTLPLAALHRPDGSSLREGDVVQLQAAADDWDDLDPFREPGRSHVVEIRVVDRNEFDLTLNQEQTDVQQKLLRLREKELQALQQTDEAERRLKQVEKLQPKEGDQSDEAKKKRAEVEKLQKEIGDELEQAQQLQKEIQEGVGDPKDGARAQAARLLDAVRANGLRNSPVGVRMEAVQKELQRLGENELQQIDPKLTAAMKEAELLDPKNKEQRKALMEEQARDLDRQAREAEQEAQARSGAADRAEQRAEDSREAAEKARLRQEAERARKEAEELRSKASALHKEAERERDDANAEAPAAAPRQAVAQAQEMQQEVEKTLNDLLNRMEAFSSTREVRGEAGKLLQDQRKLEAQAEELEDKLLGKRPEELKEGDKASLNALRDAQKRLEERTQQLLGKMQRMAEDRAQKDPGGARELKDALKQAQDAGLDDDMKRAADKLDKNQLTGAEADQKAAAAELQKLAQGLQERREQDLDQLAKKLAEKQAELEKLKKDQDELEKKIKKAEADKDQQELERLGKKQKELAQKAKDLGEQLTKLGAERAGRAAQEAAQAMENAADRLEKGQKPEDAALDRLQDAQDEADQAQQDAQDELEREKQAHIAEMVQGLRDRQEALNEDVARSHDALVKNKHSRPLVQGVLNLSQAQQGLAGETADLGHKQLADAPVLLRLMLRASESMNNAAERLTQGAKDEGVVGDDAVRAQQDALHRLELVLGALKSDDQALPQKGGQQGGQAGQPGQQGNAGEQPDSVPPLAQLKVLRAMQKEVNDRTAAFQKDHPAAAKFGDKEKTELQDIRREQQDVIDLVDEFRHPPEQGGEGDKK